MTASTTAYPAARLVSAALGAGLDIWLTEAETVCWHGPADVRQAWAPTLQSHRAMLVAYLLAEVWPGRIGR